GSSPTRRTSGTCSPPRWTSPPSAPATCGSSTSASSRCSARSTAARSRRASRGSTCTGGGSTPSTGWSRWVRTRWWSCARRTTMAEDVLELLVAQHARIEELFRAVMAADGEQRRDRFEELARLLAVHETAEEEALHPVARRTIDAGPAVVDARLAEERQ